MYGVRLESGRLMRQPLDELAAAGTRQADVKACAERFDSLRRVVRSARAGVLDGLGGWLDAGGLLAFFGVTLRQ